MPHMRLANPEAHWSYAEVPQAAAERQARRCLGRLDETVTPLSGGRANLVMRLGDARVLRVYLRDPACLDKEVTLLQHGWQSFRVPRVLARGDDYLLLEHIPHAPLDDDAPSGAALGTALAEIHATRLPQHGHIDESLRVVEPMPDIASALVAYARQNLTSLEGDAAAPAATLTALRVAITSLDERRGELGQRIGGPVLLHGDFKVSNLHRAEDGSLLVLDWEFAFAGPALYDVGQLFRWQPSTRFEDAFAEAYRSAGGVLPERWKRAAATLDLANLVGLLARGSDDARRVADLVERIQDTVRAR